MKKLGLMALAALLMVAFTVPAWAMENQFGGYWRTRMYTIQNFTGEDESEAMDWSGVDTRTRLYYTAVFHENLKFVNKFEFNSVWGDTNGGDIGADGTGHIRVKNSYADFNLGPVNAKIGIQGGKIARGFFFDDDFSGAVVSFNGPGFSIPLYWIKAFEGGMGKDANDLDVDYYGISPTFNLADGNISINPFAFYAYSKDISAWNPVIHANGQRAKDTVNPDNTFDEFNLYFAGLNFDAKFGTASLWLTGIYEGGTIDLKDGRDFDVSAWLAAAGFTADFGVGNVHGQFFYATGDDGKDEDFEYFFVPSQNYNTGQSYYWAEIMGYGIFDNWTSRNAPADKISNVMAANLGVTIKPMDKLTITFDAWYAALAEDIMVNGSEENYLGTELDLVITYELVKGLNLDIVGAYLIAGEATTLDSKDEADPYEIGTRLSLSF